MDHQMAEAAVRWWGPARAPVVTLTASHHLAGQVVGGQVAPDRPCLLGRRARTVSASDPWTTSSIHPHQSRCTE